MVRKVITEEFYFEKVTELLVQGQDRDAVDAAFAFKYGSLEELRNLVVDDNRKHARILAQTRDSVEGAELKVIESKKEVHELKAQAGKGKKIVAEDVKRKLEQAKQKIEHKKRMLDLELDEMSKNIKSEGNELAQAYDDKVEEAENSLEIRNKIYSKLQKELTHREEIKMETVDLAQELLDNMIAATEFILKVNNASDRSSKEFSAEYEDIRRGIDAYKTKKDKIDRFHT